MSYIDNITFSVNVAAETPPRLETLSQDDFYVLVPGQVSWGRSAISWSHGAQPGDWVRRYRSNDEAAHERVLPDGMIVGALSELQAEEHDGRNRFLVLWFR